MAAPPYDVVNRSEAAALALGNPLSFLHIGRSEIDLPADIGPYDDRVYQRAGDNLQEFIRQGILVQDDEPALYVYEQTMDGRVQAGVVGCVHVDDYENDIIKKHEKTRPDKEDDRTRHVLTLNANAEPVFLTYRRQPFISGAIATARKSPPLEDFTTADGVRHRTWRLARHRGVARRLSSGAGRLRGRWTPPVCQRLACREGPAGAESLPYR